MADHAAREQQTSTQREGAAAGQHGTTQPNASAQGAATSGAQGTHGAQSTQGTQAGAAQSDRQRELRTSREAPERQRSSAQTGLQRQQGAALPAYGGFGASPFSLMRRMMEDMDRFLEDFTGGRAGLAASPSVAAGLGAGQRGAMAQWAPQVEVFRRGDDMVVRADVPGIRPDDIDIEVDNDVLTISGERRQEAQEDREGFFHSERSYGNFMRSIPLPEGVQPDQVQATCRDGVLEVTVPLPKEQQQSRRRIPVRS